MLRSLRLAGLAMLGCLSSATAQRSTITRDAFRPRADSLILIYLAESRAPSAAFAVIRGNDTLADRDAIVGNYTLQLPGGQTLPIRFFLDGTRLMAQAQGQAANEIRYLGNCAFGVAFDPELRFTFTLEAGKAARVTLLQGGATIEGPRVP